MDDRSNDFGLWTPCCSVWVINTKSSSVVLKSGTVISNLEPVEVLRRLIGRDEENTRTTQSCVRW